MYGRVHVLNMQYLEVADDGDSDDDAENIEKEQYYEHNGEDSYIVTQSNQKRTNSENKLKRNFSRDYKYYNSAKDNSATSRIGGIGKQLRAKRRKLFHSPDRRPPPFKIKAHKVHF